MSEISLASWCTTSMVSFNSLHLSCYLDYSFVVFYPNVLNVITQISFLNDVEASGTFKFV